MPALLPLALALLAVTAPAPVPTPLIIAHRGASYDAPENTVAAARLAWARGADAVEVDVRLTRDGHVVALHDATLERTTGRADSIHTLTLAEAQALDAGRWKAARWAGEPVPTLEALLGTVPEGQQLVVEIKAGAEILEPLREALSGVSPDRVVLIAFDYETIRGAKRLMPEVPALWLSTLEQRDGGGGPTVGTLVARAQEARLDGLDVQATPAVDAAFVQAVHDAGLTLYVWTVNDAAEARRLAAAGVDGITTDRPQWLRERLTAPTE